MSEAADHPNVQIKNERNNTLGKRKASADSVASDDSDSDCVEVNNPYTSGAQHTVTPDTRDDEACEACDDDCIITGRSGHLALSDVGLRFELGHSQAH